eukprot:123919-Pelagomonas_calceolata.AAC.4
MRCTVSILLSSTCRVRKGQNNVDAQGPVHANRGPTCNTGGSVATSERMNLAHLPFSDPSHKFTRPTTERAGMSRLNLKTSKTCSLAPLKVSLCLHTSAQKRYEQRGPATLRAVLEGASDQGPPQKQAVVKRKETNEFTKRFHEAIKVASAV